MISVEIVKDYNSNMLDIRENHLTKENRGIRIRLDFKDLDSFESIGYKLQAIGKELVKMDKQREG